MAIVQDPPQAPVDAGEQSARRLGVAMLIHRFHPHVGGAETQLKALSPHLTQRGIDVHVIARSEPGARRQEIVDSAHVHRVPVGQERGSASIGYTLRAIQYLWRRRQSIDLIHAHGLLSPSTTAILARALLRVPVVVTTHGFQADLNLLRNGPLGSQRFALTGRSVDRFVVISDEIKSGLLAQGIEPRKLVSIRNGIDTDRFVAASPLKRAEIRGRLAVRNRKVVAYMGRLEAVKGTDTLLDAWPDVLCDVPDAELLIAGEGAARADLMARNVPRVRFLGAQSDPLPLYQSADCYVLPSRSEGLPVALLEALSVGLPTVSTAVGGATEILRGYESEALVSPDRPDDLAQRLITQLRSPWSEAIRSALRDRVRSDYSIATTADQLTRLYRSLVSAEVTQ